MECSIILTDKDLVYIKMLLEKNGELKHSLIKTIEDALERNYDRRMSSYIDSYLYSETRNPKGVRVRVLNKEHWHSMEEILKKETIKIMEKYDAVEAIKELDVAGHVFLDEFSVHAYVHIKENQDLLNRLESDGAQIFRTSLKRIDNKVCCSCVFRFPIGTVPEFASYVKEKEDEYYKQLNG